MEHSTPTIHDVDALMRLLDTRLAKDFSKVPKNSAIDPQSLIHLRKSMVSSLRHELIQKKIDNFNHVMHTWRYICEKTIPRWVKKSDTKNSNSLQKRLKEDKFMKFVSIVGVVGLTVGYLVTVSLAALGTMALLASFLNFRT